ncbi:hypothetical protein ACFX12_022850 [Malus domestica]
MKTSLCMFRRFELHKNDAKDKKDIQPLAQVDELAQAAQDMQDMRNCHDSLLSAAAATGNSTYVRRRTKKRRRLSCRLQPPLSPTLWVHRYRCDQSFFSYFGSKDYSSPFTFTTGLCSLTRSEY